MLAETKLGMKKDTQIFNLIEEEKNRQLHGIELIASENFVSNEVMEAMGSVLTNKYAEGLYESTHDKLQTTPLNQIKNDQIIEKKT